MLPFMGKAAVDIDIKASPDQVWAVVGDFGGLDKWLPAIWVAANPESGISSHELARAVGTTQKSAWFMLHRIREAMPAVPPAPAPPAAPLPETPEQESARRYLAWILLAVFALGAVFGWLAARLGRRR